MTFQSLYEPRIYSLHMRTNKQMRIIELGVQVIGDRKETKFELKAHSSVTY